MDFFTTPGRRRTNSVWSHTEAQLSLGKLAQIFYLVKGPKCIMSSLIPNGQLQCSLQSWSRCASCHALCFACIFKWLFKQRINWKKYLSKVRVWESPRVIKLFYTFFFLTVQTLLFICCPSLDVFFLVCIWKTDLSGWHGIFAPM